MRHDNTRYPLCFARTLLPLLFLLALAGCGSGGGGSAATRNSATTWTVSASAGTGTTWTITATPPATGYRFVNWTENGTEVSASADYTFTAAADRSLVAHFDLKRYSVTASAGAGSSITPASTTVADGAIFASDSS